jgi:hypothetical protein
LSGNNIEIINVPMDKSVACNIEYDDTTIPTNDSFVVTTREFIDFEYDNKTGLIKRFAKETKSKFD